MATTSDKAQRGGFALGMVVGVLLGLALALGVALYVSKVPVPFIDKVPQRTPEQDAAEAEKNRNWDPNAPLASKAPLPKPAASADNPAGAASAGGGVAPLPPQGAASAGRPAPSGASAVSSKSAADAFVYFVQVAAFSRAEEAEQLRAKLALAGLTAKVTERESNGRVMYRVRLGPYDAREDAERVKEQAMDTGYGESTLVRVNR